MLNTAECTGDGRVIFVASRRHSQGVFDPSNINGETSYSRCAFYNNSKLYNVSYNVYSQDVPVESLTLLNNKLCKTVLRPF